MGNLCPQNCKYWGGDFLKRIRRTQRRFMTPTSSSYAPRYSNSFLSPNLTFIVNFNSSDSGHYCPLAIFFHFHYSRKLTQLLFNDLIFVLSNTPTYLICSYLDWSFCSSYSCIVSHLHWICKESSQGDGRPNFVPIGTWNDGSGCYLLSSTSNPVRTTIHGRNWEDFWGKSQIGGRRG